MLSPHWVLFFLLSKSSKAKCKGTGKTNHRIYLFLFSIFQSSLPPSLSLIFHLPLGSVVAGVIDWYRPHPRADGLSVTLYEKQAGANNGHHGDPIADAFFLTARPNSCIMALADGINWGHKPRLAARSALLGVVEHLNEKLFSVPTHNLTTQDIFHHILLSFDEGQKRIVTNGGTTTTLTVAMICECLPNHHVSSKWILCSVSVGDSPCFLYQPDYGTVHEVTAAWHDGKGRDPRDSGGCLGTNVGNDPDLSNLICCLLPVKEGDFVFLTSDGISDNFDPVLLKEAMVGSTSPTPPSSQPHFLTPQSSVSISSLPSVTPKQRQEILTEKMATIIKEKQRRIEHMLTAQDIIEALVTHVKLVTDDKRKFLEQVWEESSDPSLSPSTRRDKERKQSQKSKLLPGKLDHTTVVAYQVGMMSVSHALMGESSPRGSRPASQSSVVPLVDDDPNVPRMTANRREQYQRGLSTGSFYTSRY